jgi:REP element-mobilizing transposase RayT
MHTLTDKSTMGLLQSGPRIHQDRYYHVVLSGNRRKTLFSTVDDRRALNVIATDTLQRFEGTLHAYCLMTNHFRALVQIDSRSLIKALRQIGTRYSHHRQRHLKPAPHLFERPYVAQRIDTDGDFLNLLRAIHLTPVIANKAIAPADYLWSSHRAYLGYKSVTKVVTEFGLSLLAESPAQARVAYHQFIQEGMAEDFGRAKDPKSQTKNHDSSASQPLANTDNEDVPPSLSESRIQLPRFGRQRRRSDSRRFLSVY